MIFSLLLNHNGLIEHDEATEHRINVGRSTQAYQDRIHLSSQLLRTCQILYREAGDYLYYENTLVVGFQHHGSYGNEYFCHMLDLHIEIMHDLSSPLTGIVDLLSYAETLHRNWPITASTYQALVALWPSLLRFKKLQINIDIPSQSGIFLACYMMRSLLLDKTVKVSMPDSERLWTGSGSCHPANALWGRNWPRRRSISVIAVRDKGAADTVEYLTSFQVVRDILPLFNNLHKLLGAGPYEFHWERSISNRADDGEAQHLVDALQSSLCRNDVEDVLRIIDSILVKKA